MARYFFHLCDGTDILLDPEGRVIDDAVLISHLALKEARAIISHEALGGSIDLHQSIEVRDEGGTTVHRLSFRDAVAIRD